MRVVGVDVGSRRVDAVALNDDGRVLGARVFPVADLDALLGWADGAAAVCVDSPDRWSTAPHAGDLELAPKFRSARCGEIGLGRHFRIWVPWTTPVAPAPRTWMDVGVRLFAALRAAGHEPLEVYPHGAFRVLGGGLRPPSKQTVAGIEARVRALEAAGVRCPALGMWGHDGLDAAVAALVALHHLRGRAVPASCGHDGSAIWLPAASEGTAGTGR
ncbi:MAG: DUF429 domain-containing protein [Acidimicrobiales bacterium]